MGNYGVAVVMNMFFSVAVKIFSKHGAELRKCKILVSVCGVCYPTQPIRKQRKLLYLAILTKLTIPTKFKTL